MRCAILTLLLAGCAGPAVTAPRVEIADHRFQITRDPAKSLEVPSRYRMIDPGIHPDDYETQREHLAQIPRITILWHLALTNPGPTDISAVVLLAQFPLNDGTIRRLEFTVGARESEALGRPFLPAGKRLHGSPSSQSWPLAQKQGVGGAALKSCPDFCLPFDVQVDGAVDGATLRVVSVR